MQPKRLSVKFYIEQPHEINLPECVTVFQQWIQRQAVEGMLIDVVDYKHVHHGPGVVLIAHEADYGLDLGEGRPGLLYVRKRDVPPTLETSLHTAFRQALLATKELATEPSLPGLRFNYSEVRIAFIDRLNTPNTLEAFEATVSDVRTFLETLYEDVEISRAGDDPRDLLEFAIKTSNAADVDSLLAKLGQTERVTG